MRNPFKNKTFAIVGLGRSGLATAHRLKALGANIYVDDDTESAKQAAVADGFVALKRPLQKGTLDAVILSPGIPLTHPAPHPIVQEANAAAIPIRGDVDLYMEYLAQKHPKTKVVGITGTNGKSTTTALLGHMLNAAGKSAIIAGNIGMPIWSIPEPDADDILVIEYSSYQIDLSTHLNTFAAIFLNITPDHLDRHGTIENYAHIKERLLVASDNPCVVVDDTFTQATAEKLKNAGHTLTTIANAENKTPADISYWTQSDIRDHTKDTPFVATLSKAEALRGRHNAQNAAAAVAVALKLGLRDEQIQSGLNTFGGLAHRMERVAEKILMGQNGTQHRLLFINDSKATNAAASEPALKTFDCMYWLAGGLAKSDGIDALVPYTRKMRSAYVFGQDRKRFAKTLEGHVECHEVETLPQAIHAATKAALTALNTNAADAQDDTEIVVLLSPASASFDAYPNFEARGEEFRNTVLSILEKK